MRTLFGFKPLVHKEYCYYAKMGGRREAVRKRLVIEILLKKIVTICNNIYTILVIQAHLD